MCQGRTTRLWSSSPPTRHYTVKVLPEMKPAARETPPDAFHWLGEINKASAVMVVEQAIVPASLGIRIATAITQVLSAGQQPNAPRPHDYLIVEAALIEAGGPDVTRVHAGRSRQDIGATCG